MYNENTKKISRKNASHAPIFSQMTDKSRVGQILMEHGERGYFMAKFRAESEFEKKNVKK